ncbi:MAG: hypothetical protein QG635_1843, partial [Bacteroidota bacterium]|nr:hypothetical protein [Bacteroidota bacterium]
RNIEFYITGRGAAPKLTFESDTLDFGTVFTNPPADCNSDRDTTFRLRNTGNDTLVIRYIDIKPVTNYTFSETEIKIPPASDYNLSCTFNKTFDFAEYFATAYFYTNESYPEDTVRLTLHAVSIPPIRMHIEIPKNLKGMPGSLLSVPILVGGDTVKYSRTFIDTLTYDKTLLKFINYDNVNTAAAGADIQAVPLANGGSVALNIRILTNKFFASSDTLVKLIFKVFLGDRTSSPISFSEPKFGDGKCSEVLNVNGYVNDGVFKLDSVCGLDLKAYPRASGIFRFEQPQPNPAKDVIELNYETSFEANVRFTIYDSYGMEVAIPLDRLLPAGEYSQKYDIGGLPHGAYFIEMRAGIFRKVRTIIKDM